MRAFQLFQTCEGDLLLALAFQRIMVWASECKKCRNVVTMKTKRTTYFFPTGIGLMCILEKSGPDTVVTRIVLLVALTLPYLDSTFSLPDSILHLGMSKLAILFDFFHLPSRLRLDPHRCISSSSFSLYFHSYNSIILVLVCSSLILSLFFLPFFSSCDFGVCSIFPFLLVSTVLPAPLLAELAGWLPFLVSLPFPASTAFGMRVAHASNDVSSMWCFSTHANPFLANVCR